MASGCRFLDEFDLLLVDLDGVVWIDGEPIPENVSVLRGLVEEGRVTIVTNNSTRSRRLYQLLLARIGLKLPVGRIVTSAWVASWLLGRIRGESLVYAVGEEGLVEELASAGHVVLTVGEAWMADAVVVGLDRGLTYQRLKAALDALRRGALFVATNTDNAMPGREGIVPGAGSIVEALSTASGRKPDYVAGKPGEWMARAALEASGRPRPERVLVVGDRVDTDARLAEAIGAKALILGTGVYKGPPPQIHYYAPSLEDLCREGPTLGGVQGET